MVAHNVASSSILEYNLSIFLVEDLPEGYALFKGMSFSVVVGNILHLSHLFEMAFAQQISTK